MDIYHAAKFPPDRIRGFVSAHVRLRASKGLLGYFFVFWGVGFSDRLHGFLTQNTSKDAILRKDVPFGGRKAKI